MTFVVADRVQETCAAPGTGTVTLLGAATGYQSFSAGIGANNTTFYAIADQGGSNWEVGLGTIGATGLTLTRTTVFSSSNAGSLVNFSVGIQNIWCDYPASKSVYANGAILVAPSGALLPVANGGIGVATASANQIFAGPSTGSAAAPSFRALVAADIPSTYSEFASGTALLFQQTTAPTGWTKVTTNTDAALRVVSGTVGTGGTVAFSTAFASQTPAGSVTVSGGSVSATTLTSTQIPSHTHGYSGYTAGMGGGNPHGHSLSNNGQANLVCTYPAGQSNDNGATTNINYNGIQVYLRGSTDSSDINHSHSYSGTTDVGTGGNGSHTHGFTTPTASFTGNAINLAVKYVDVIIATKN